MATTYATEAATLEATPQIDKPDAKNMGARPLILRATITFADQASGDIIILGKVPAGYRFSHGLLNTDTSTGTATLAIGKSGSTGKYRAAAVRTTANAPEVFGVVAAMTELTADETIQALVGTAALPSSGTCYVEMVFTKAG